MTPPLSKQITVYMAATGKARPRVVKRGRHVTTYMPEAYTAARDELALRFGPPEVPPPWRVDVRVTRPMPKSWSNKRRLANDGRPTTAKPDVDNILGWVLDAIMPDDEQVVDGRCVKVWGRDAAIKIAVTHVPPEVPIHE